MATPPFLNGQSSPSLPPQRPTKVAKRGRAKKPNKKNLKKPPQRGLGVAQLERLRIEEMLKNTTEMIKSDNQTQYQPISPAEMLPLGGFPVLWNYALGVPMISDGSWLGQGLVDLYGCEAPERMRFNDDHQHHALKSSKELSSIPNFPQSSKSQSFLLDCCCNSASCFKKNCTNGKTNFAMSDGEFLGLSMENSINNRRIKGFEATPSNELQPRFPINEAAASSIGHGSEAVFCNASYPIDLSLKLSF